MTYQGATYTAVVNVGQQGGSRHRMEDNDIVIGERDDITIYNTQHVRVRDLVAGNEYTFDDFFPEEIDVNSIQISNGLVNITGNSGLQTITFTPQLSDGDDIGGGVITATTLNGNRISYPYNVSATAPTPTSRRIIVKCNGEEGLFRITTEGLNARTSDYIEMNLNDGTIINITAVPNEGYTLDKWLVDNGTQYTTPSITLTVGSTLIGQDGNILVLLEYKKSERTVNLTLNSGTDGYITIGNDSRHFSSVTRTVTEGTTITNIKVTANSNLKPFLRWSDGSVSNPRDITVYRNTTLTALYQDNTEATITIDGNGLFGGGDDISFALDGDKILACGIGQNDSISVTKTAYDVELTCNINDLDSKFNNFTINGNDYYDNPLTQSNYNINQDMYVEVKTIPSGFYYIEDNRYDQALVDQAPFVDDSMWKVEQLNNLEIKVDTNYASDYTVAFPINYEVIKLIDENDNDVYADFTFNKSDNDNWIVGYTDKAVGTSNYTFVLQLI